MNKEQDKEQRGQELLAGVNPGVPAPDETPEQMQVFGEWANELACSPGLAYMARRGFARPDGSPDVAFLRKWRVGYTRNHNGKGEAIIIPTAGGAKFARSIDEGEERVLLATKGEPRFLFNERALYQSEKPVVIVEGEIDALSVLHAADDVVEAVGLGGVHNWRKVLSLVKGGHVKARRFIIALDNDHDDPKDKAGPDAKRRKIQNTARDIQCALACAGLVAVLSNDLYGIDGKGCKDANEMLQVNRALLRDRLAGLAGLANAEPDPGEAKIAEYVREHCALSGLKDFLSDEPPPPPAPTGIASLDDLLDGGLYEGLYILFSTPGAGKTTLLLQIAAHIAESGRDVLFIALEMSKQSLQARSLSRLSGLLYTDDAAKYAALSERQISARKWYYYRSPELKEKCRKTVSKAIAIYEHFAQNLFILEPKDCTLAGVIAAVEQHVRLRGRACAPVVMLDYLQILRSSSVGLTDKQAVDSHVLRLKQLSRDYGIPVLAVSSLSRQSYAERLTLSSGKESGGIEFSSDVVLGLQLLGVGTKGFDPEAAQRDPLRKIELAALKNRTGKLDSVCLRYNPKFNAFFDAPELLENAATARKDAAEYRGKRRK